MSNLTHKEIAVAFLREASAGSVRAAYEAYVHPAFSHHNPYFKGDRASLMQGMLDSAKQFPDKQFEPLRTMEEGALVAVHARLRLKPDSPWMVLIHIFRFEGDLIIEEWEASYQVPDDSPNENGVL
jgi:predicted SnoaL-like aldol condensation-catalyzing enzyme